MSRRRSGAGALSLALLAACACEGTKAAPSRSAEDAGATATSSAPDAASATPVASASPALPDDAAATDAVATPRWAFDCSDTSAPKAGKSIGHTSIVFKIELSSDKKAAWKPNAKKVKGRYKGEVAAYRLAQALGLPNVPPACLRTFEAPAATSALATNAEAAKLFASDVIVEDGKVHGVVIPWIDGLSFWPLEKEPLRTEARTWLTAGADIPKAKIDLARQASTLVAFDFLTDNWDRYSGENVGLDRDGRLVLYIDNDAAFMEGPPLDRVARNKALLDATDRFSRSFVARVRALDAERLAAAFGEDAAGKPLLGKSVVTAVATRVKKLLAAIDQKIVKRGEAETLYFP